MKQAVLTMGLPASGKSTVVNKLYGHLVTVDCDSIKELHPQYDRKNPAPVHAWSKAVMEHMLRICIEDNDSFVYDSTGTDTEHLEKLVSILHSNGYIVTLLKVEVSIDTAISRNKGRDRTVPEHIIHDKFQKMTEAFNKISQLVDSHRVIVNE